MDLWTSCHVWGKVLGTILENCWSGMLARGDLGHPCRDVTEQNNTNWVLAVGEQRGLLKCGGGISYQCQACSTIWGQAFGGKMETMEIFSSTESWNNLRRLGAAGQLSRLRSPFQIHERSQAVLNRYSKTDARSWVAYCWSMLFWGAASLSGKRWFL